MAQDKEQESRQEQEYQQVLHAMKDLLRRAHALADPILERWAREAGTRIS
jgi:hypothetical protein